MINSIQKPRLRKEYGYVLASKQFDNLLLNNNISIYIDLIYWVPQQLGSIFEAHYWLPNENISYERLYVRAGALRVGDISGAKKLLITDVFPAFIRWLQKIIESPTNSTIRTQEPYFNAVYEKGKIIYYQ